MDGPQLLGRGDWTPRPESTTTSTRGTKSLARHARNPQACPETFRRVDQIAPPLAAVARELAEGRAPWPLYLWGPAGTGKTSAALAMLDWFGPVLPADLTATPPALDWLAGYVAARSVVGTRIAADKGRLTWAKPGTGSDALTWQMLASRLAAAPLLVLDDIGVGGDREFAVQTLLELLDPRCGHPAKPTVVVGNLPPSGLAPATDDRVADRVLAGTVFQLAGDSRRPGQAVPAAPRPALAG